MKKSFVVLVLGAFMSMCFCQENDIKVIFANERHEYYKKLPTNKYVGCSVASLEKVFLRPSRYKAEFVVDDEWIKKYDNYYELSKRGVRLVAGDVVYRIIWDDMENTFFVVADKIWDYDDGMHSASRFCFYDEIFAMKKGEEWVVFASKRGMRCLIPVDD